MSKDTSKTSSATATTASDPFADCYGGEPPKGLESVGNPDIDGWWNPKAGLVFHGQICGHFTIEDKKRNSTRDVVLVKLARPTLAVESGSETPVKLEAGAVLAVGISYKLREMLSYVEHKGQVWAKTLEKSNIGGGQTMWKYDLRMQGKKAPPPVASAISSDDDGAPF